MSVWNSDVVKIYFFRARFNKNTVFLSNRLEFFCKTFHLRFVQFNNLSFRKPVFDFGIAVNKTDYDFVSMIVQLFCNPGKIFFMIIHIVLFSQNYGVVPPDNFFPADLFRKPYEFFNYFLFMRDVFFYILCIRCNCKLKIVLVA